MMWRAHENGYLIPPQYDLRWAGVERRLRFNNGSGQKSSLRIECLNKRPVRIAVVGHSFIRRICDDLTKSRGYFHNFGMDFDVASVDLIYDGGMKIFHARQRVLFDIMKTFPDLVYIELGSNDVCRRWMSPREIGDDMCDLVAEILRLGAIKVIVGETAYRYGKGVPKRMGHYNYRVSDLNRYLQVQLDEEFNPGTAFWRHKGIWNCKKQIYLSDGIHFNALGNRRLYRSIRGAIITGIWDILDQI